MDELRTSSKSLATALEQYLSSFSSFTDRFDTKPAGTLGDSSYAAIAMIHSELESISKYKKKLKQIKAVASQARNSLPSLVPINALPSDLLAYIFKLVLETQPCLNGGPEDKAPSLFRYPEILSHVCARWRCVAIDSCALWSHIDIAPEETTSPFCETDKRVSSRILLTRARAFVARARDAPLGVHFGSRRILKEGTDVDLATFCATIAPRVKYLDFAPGDFGHSACANLVIFLMACSPGMLRQLAIRCRDYAFACDTPFIDTIVASIDMPAPLSQLPGDFVGQLLLPVDVLRFKYLYLSWTSQAYRGLTELRLIGRKSIITQLQLSGILAASPDLRVFHFGLTIIDATPQPTPTILPALRILNLGSIDHISCQALLPLILPGLEPVQFVLRISPPPGEFWNTALASLLTNQLECFFARSNVAELYLESHGDREDPNYQLLPQMLKLLPLPRLRKLYLGNFDFSYRKMYPRDSSDTITCTFDGPNLNLASHFACSKLQVLSFINCNLDLTDVREVIEVLPIQEMKLAHCHVFAKTNCEDGWKYGYRTPEQVQREVENTAAFPGIQVKLAISEMLRDEWDSWPRE